MSPTLMAYYNLKEMVDANKVFIFGGIAAISATILIGSAIWLGSSTCRPGNTEPILDLNNMRQVESKDKTALVNFEGYLAIRGQMNDTTRRFLALSTESLEVYAEDTKLDVVVGTNCAKIIIKVVPASSSPRYFIKKMTAEFSDENGIRRACSTDELDIYYDKMTHYTCRRLRTHYCQGTNPDGEMIELSINYGLEIEVYRDPKQAKSGQYLTPPKYCEDY